MNDRVYKLNNQAGELSDYGFYCPGCKCHHSYDIKRWKFNGDFKKPTFTPSLLIWASRPALRCHLFVTDGRIRYLGDCFHHLAGKTIEMESIE